MQVETQTTTHMEAWVEGEMDVGGERVGAVEEG
jgi:hypothetical protein